MASGFIGNDFSNKTGEIHGTTLHETTIQGTTGQVDAKITTTNGKIPAAIPAITTYQGKTTKDIKVTVDNKTRIIYAELTDSFLRQKGITNIWYDLYPGSPNYQWLCYKVSIDNDIERIVKVAQFTTFTDLEQAINDIEQLIHNIEQTLINKINKKQDQIKFITISTVNEDHGYLPDEDLIALNASMCNRILYDNIVYTFSYKRDHLRYYYSACPATKNNLIRVNDTTGEYILYDSKDPAIIDLENRLNTHITDTNVHIQEREREFWNNKVTAYIESTDSDNRLILTDEDIII